MSCCFKCNFWLFYGRLRFMQNKTNWSVDQIFPAKLEEECFWKIFHDRFSVMNSQHGHQPGTLQQISQGQMAQICLALTACSFFGCNHTTPVLPRLLLPHSSRRPHLVIPLKLSLQIWHKEFLTWLSSSTSIGVLWPQFLQAAIINELRDAQVWDRAMPLCLSLSS